jgi:hypothetical protein
MVGREKELSIQFVPGNCQLVEVRESVRGARGVLGASRPVGRGTRVAPRFVHSARRAGHGGSGLVWVLQLRHLLFLLLDVGNNLLNSQSWYSLCRILVTATCRGSISQMSELRHRGSAVGTGIRVQGCLTAWGFGPPRFARWSTVGGKAMLDPLSCRCLAPEHSWVPEKDVKKTASGCYCRCCFELRASHLQSRPSTA